MANEAAKTTKEYKIDKLSIRTDAGITLDISETFVELEIFQSIYGLIYGNFILTDAKEAFSKFSFSGNEFLDVKIGQQGLPISFERTFRIYKISDRSVISNSSQRAIFHFISEDAFTSQSMLVSKAYKNSKIRDIVVDILQNELNVDTKKINQRDIEATQGNYDLIVPNLHPIQAIQWVASRAYSQNKFCYMFFENKDGYKFTSLQTLMSQPSVKTMKYEVKTIDNDPSVNKDGIDKFDIKNDFDILTTMSNGGFSSRLLSVDIFSQSYDFSGYDINIAESKGNLLNKYKSVGNIKNKKGESLLNAPGNFYRTYLSVNNTQTEKSNDIKFWLLPRALHLSLLNNFKINVISPGDINMKAGDIISVEFPTFEPKSDSGRDINRRYSGKYLTAAVNWKFTGAGANRRFECIAQLVSDSLSEQTPDAPKKG